MPLNRSNPLKLASIALAVIALAIVGCGGSDSGEKDDSASTSGTLTETELISKADEICQDTKDKVSAIGPAALESKDPEKMKSATDEIEDLNEQKVESLQELVPPAEIASDYKTWTAGLEKSIELLDEIESSSSTAKMKELQDEAVDVATKTQELGVKLGFTVCA